MNAEDYAIIVGLQDYPGLDDPANGQPPLAGPENDAEAFRNWVISSAGGDVPDGQNGTPNHVTLILSRNYNNPPFTSVFDAKPVAADVENAFRRLRKQSEDNAAAGRGLRVGRRLYIFLAGHGIAPETYGDKNGQEAALLMANVERSNVGASYHIPGAYAATWFCRNTCFDEVFLFMDCCRESALVQGLNQFLPPKGNADTAKRCYAFGTRWSRLSREHPMADEGNKTRGVFTKTLLLGLCGAAAEPDPANPTQGLITVASLKSYLYQNMKEFLDPAFATDSNLQEPDVDYWPKSQEGRDILIKSAPLQKFPVNIHPPSGATGARVVFFQNNKQVKMAETNAAPATWSIQLPRGKYIAQVVQGGNIVDQEFDVKGIEGLAGKGGADVDFKSA